MEGHRRAVTLCLSYIGDFNSALASPRLLLEWDFSAFCFDSLDPYYLGQRSC